MELKELPKSYWNRANCSGFEEFMNCKDAKNATFSLLERQKYFLKN